MAVSNSITKTQGNKSSQLVSFQVNGATVELSPQIVKDYLVSGDKDRVTTQEIVMFINLCKFNGLNPWLKEAYCIKYGTEPATMVTGKEAFEKRAENHPQHDGHKAGIITIDGNGIVEYQIGSFRKPDSEIIGGWAEVWRKDHRESTRIEVSFDEYAGRRKDGTLNGQWSKKPGTMIRKVALVQALREAFPHTFGGLVDISETNFDSSVIDVTPVEPPKMNTGDTVVASDVIGDPVGDFFNTNQQ